MPVIVESIPSVRSAALAWLIPAGSATDPEDLQGLSPLYAELLMRGAGDRDSRAHADAMDRLGASRSSEAGTTFVHVSATVLGDQMARAMGLIVDMVRRPRMDESSLEPARTLAIQAIQSLQDDPQGRASLLARQRHLPEPINRSGLGTIEGLEAATREDVVRGWSRRARPGGSILAIAGAVNAEALFGRLDRLLDGWEGSAEQIVPKGVPPRGYAHEPDESSQVQIMVLCDAPPEPDPDSMLERVVIGVLSGGMSCRLFTEVRERRGLCYSVSASYKAQRDFGLVRAYVGTTPERAQESLDVLIEQLKRINTPEGRITPEEFQRAIVGMKSRVVFSGESTAARAGALAGDQHRLGRPRPLAEIAGQIDRITLDQVNEYLGRRELGRLTIQTLGPGPLTPPSE